MTQYRDSGNTLAGASDTTGDPLGNRRPDEAVELTPVVLYGKGVAVPETDDHLYDFTPKTVEDEPIGLEDVEAEDLEVGDPKDSSAPASALSAIYEKVKTHLPVHLQPSESSSDLEPPVDVDKGSTMDAESKTGSESGTPPSKP